MSTIYINKNIVASSKLFYNTEIVLQPGRPSPKANEACRVFPYIFTKFKNSPYFCKIFKFQPYLRLINIFSLI